MTDLEYVASHLSEEELLCQIAEEASELAQAALKMRRAITQRNPTPKTPEAALNDLWEEYEDLLNALNAYVIKTGNEADEAQSVSYSKLHRWADRIKEKEIKNHEN